MRTIQHGKFLLVEIKGLVEQRINKPGASPYRLLLTYNYTLPVDRIRLPIGEWIIVAKASELTEEQAMEIVECIHVGAYRNYLAPAYSEYLKDTAIESLITLCQSNQMSPSTTLILKQQ